MCWGACRVLFALTWVGFRIRRTARNRWKTTGSWAASSSSPECRRRAWPGAAVPIRTVSFWKHFHNGLGPTVLGVPRHDHEFARSYGVIMYIFWRTYVHVYYHDDHKYTRKLLLNRFNAYVYVFTRGVSVVSTELYTSTCSAVLWNKKIIIIIIKNSTQPA